MFPHREDFTEGTCVAHGAPWAKRPTHDAVTGTGTGGAKGSHEDVMGRDVPGAWHAVAEASDARSSDLAPAQVARADLTSAGGDPPKRPRDRNPISKSQRCGAGLGNLDIGKPTRAAAALEEGNAEQPDVDHRLG